MSHQNWSLRRSEAVGSLTAGLTASRKGRVSCSVGWFVRQGLTLLHPYSCRYLVYSQYYRLGEYVLEHILRQTCSCPNVILSVCIYLTKRLTVTRHSYFRIFHTLLKYLHETGSVEESVEWRNGQTLSAWQIPGLKNLHCASGLPRTIHVSYLEDNRIWWGMWTDSCYLAGL